MAERKTKGKETSITVAVRVRPFNGRETLRGAKCAVIMSGTSTLLHNPYSSTNEPPKEFTYDFSYWSHDGFEIDDTGYRRPRRASNYADQERIYQDIGRNMIKCTMDGYNSTVFAYGQAGSGKSYTIMGDGANKGLLQRTCDELFRSQQPDVVYEVALSMLEIYNEKVRDLLSERISPPEGLRVRGDIDRGFYVEGLTSASVNSSAEVQQIIAEGNERRTIAQTKLNELSNRSHTIVTLTVTQHRRKQAPSFQSTMNFVDLAGSERQAQSESVGDRFHEATKINLSLSTLGNVISDLAERDMKKTTRYRESVLTKLLMNSLGGNCKTWMIATISPDADSYDQTLSTLRYAARVKRIKTEAKINIVEVKKKQPRPEPRHRQISESEEDDVSDDADSVKTAVSSSPSKGSSRSYSEIYVQRLKRKHELELQRQKDALAVSEREWKAKLEEAKRQQQLSEQQAKQEASKESNKKEVTYFSNLNEDPSLSDRIRHIVKPGTTLIGKDGLSDIIIYGPGVVDQHAEIRANEDCSSVVLTPCDGETLHNGLPLTEPVELADGDRVRFGSGSLYIFRSPFKTKAVRRTKIEQKQPFTYRDAQEEIVRQSCVDLKAVDLDNEDVMDELIQVIPTVHSANAMAQEMLKPVVFSAVVVSPQARAVDGTAEKPRVYINVKDRSTGCKYLWTSEKFLIRYDYMQDAYDEFKQTGTFAQVDKELDPFWEPIDLEQIIGTASIPLDCMAEKVSLPRTPISITDYLGNVCGQLIVEIAPCDKNGHEVIDAVIPVNPKSLIGKPITYKIKLIQVVGLPRRFVQARCEYRFYRNEKARTASVSGNDPVFDHEITVKISKVGNQFIDYLTNESLVVEVYGVQGYQPSSSRNTARSLRSDDGSDLELKDNGARFIQKPMTNRSEKPRRYNTFQ